MEKWYGILNNALHVALLVGSAYAATNPKYAWLLPVAQALGSSLPSPAMRPAASK